MCKETFILQSIYSSSTRWVSPTALYIVNSTDAAHCSLWVCFFFLFLSPPLLSLVVTVWRTISLNKKMLQRDKKKLLGEITLLKARWDVKSKFISLVVSKERLLNKCMTGYRIFNKYYWMNCKNQLILNKISYLALLCYVYLACIWMRHIQMSWVETLWWINTW